MEPVAVLEEPETCVVALDPLRSRLLEELAREPASAATVAGRVGISRQKVRYHLRALEDHGLVTEVDQRHHGGITERILAPSASSYVVSPAAMGGAGADPRRVADRLSSSYLLAVAGRALREVGALVRGARQANTTLSTLAIDTELRFRSPAERAAFADDLSAAVVELAARYHDESAPGGRRYRLVVLSHPRPTEETS